MCDPQREQLLGELARKTQFVMMVAHDMRNVLAPLANGVRLLVREESTIQVRPMLERQVIQLARLVDDLLDIASSEQGRMQLSVHPLDLHDVIDAAVEVALPSITAHDHHLTLAPVCPDPALVEGDRWRLTQALSNLLLNAAKYTPQGGDIRVALERDAPCFIVRVSDSGIGIAADMLPRVFDAFERAMLRTGQGHGGLGLGLTVARYLVELHGGTLYATSAGIGQGSEFVMRLPTRVQ